MRPAPMAMAESRVAAAVRCLLLHLQQGRLELAFGQQDLPEMEVARVVRRADLEHRVQFCLRLRQPSRPRAHPAQEIMPSGVQQIEHDGLPEAFNFSNSGDSGH